MTAAGCQACPFAALLQRAPRIAEIQRAVAAAWGVPAAMLLSERRGREFAFPRQVAVFLAAELTGQSLPAIGRAFDRDHTTVMHAIRQIRARIDGDRDLAARIAALRQSLGAHAL